MRAAIIVTAAVAAVFGWAAGQHDAAVLAGPQEQSFDSTAGRGTTPSDRPRAAGAIDDARASSADRLRAQLARERETLRAARRDAARWRAAAEADPSVGEAISLAATAFGQSEGYMRTIMFRESRFDPGAQNPTSTACGLAQFLDTTWAATPFARFSCTSPHANALAMAWALRTWGSSPWALTRP